MHQCIMSHTTIGRMAHFCPPAVSRSWTRQAACQPAAVSCKLCTTHPAPHPSAYSSMRLLTIRDQQCCSTCHCHAVLPCPPHISEQLGLHQHMHYRLHKQPYRAAAACIESRRACATPESSVPASPSTAVPVYGSSIRIRIYGSSGRARCARRYAFRSTLDARAWLSTDAMASSWRAGLKS